MITTARLRLRRWDEADIDPFMAALNTPGVMRWLGGVQDRDYYAKAASRMHAHQAAHGHCFWIVERSEDGAIFGFCGAKRVDLPGIAIDGAIELGWRLREDAWGQGYAREAAIATRDWCWEHLADQRLFAMTVVDNLASQKLMHRIGMHRVPDFDFAHPDFAVDHPLSAHIVYAIDRASLSRDEDL